MTRNIFQRWGASARGDWKILFSIFLLLLAGAIAWSSVLYGLVKDTDSGEDSDITRTLTREALRNAALRYDEKAAAFDRIKATPETIPDPSK